MNKVHSIIGSMWALLLISTTSPAAADSHQQSLENLQTIIHNHSITPLQQAPHVSDELFFLGQALAFDKILSGNQNISCMTCHHPTQGTGDNLALSLGEGGTGVGESRFGGHIIPRNAPPLFNLHAFKTMFWDNRVRVVEDQLITPAGAQLTPAMEAVFQYGLVSAQAMFPVTSREEMRGFSNNELGSLADDDFSGIWAALMTRLGAIPEYVDLFESAYPHTAFADMTFAHAANAIAGFEIRAFSATQTPWQAFLSGDEQILSKSQITGAIAFFESGCANCHSGATLSDFSSRNTAMPQFGPGKKAGASGTDDWGFGSISGYDLDRYTFRVPPLFNVELTGPYGHAGQYSDLSEMIKHYIRPDRSLRKYRIEKHVRQSDLYALIENNQEQVLSNVDAETFATTTNTNKIMSFLQTLTDPASTQLDWVIPNSVPSGLPVSD